MSTLDTTTPANPMPGASPSSVSTDAVRDLTDGLALAERHRGMGDYLEAYLGLRRDVEAYLAALRSAPPQQEAGPVAESEKLLGSRPDFHANAVEQLAFELAFELEDAEVNAHDLVTVNREKLRAIAERVLSRDLANPSPASLAGETLRAGVERLTKAGWQSLDTAPEDEWVLLATTGDHVGEAIMYLDDDSGKPDWQWAAKVRLHAELTPLGWQHMPRPISSPILPDNRPGGFDGPTGAD